jgi:hypothetical protein
MAELFHRALADLAALCRGDVQELAGWLERDSSRLLAACAWWVLLGGGLYGTSLGLWRSPLQATFMAVKFPQLFVHHWLEQLRSEPSENLDLDAPVSHR